MGHDATLRRIRTIKRVDKLESLLLVAPMLRQLKCQSYKPDLEGVTITVLLW